MKALPIRRMNGVLDSQTETPDRILMDNRNARMPALDGVRGLAISLVLFCHFFMAHLGNLPNHPSAARILGLGRLSWSGVDLFFVLSGFLIGGILLDAADAKNYFRVFYLRRFHRIVPLYAVLLILFFFAPLYWDTLRWAWLTNKIPWFWYASFMQNFWMARQHAYGSTVLAVTWSLAVEEQFYLSLPLIVRYVSRARVWWVVGAMIIGAPLLRLILTRELADATIANYVLMPCRADTLGLGVAVALMRRTPGLWQRAQLHRRSIYVALGAFSAAIVALLLSPFRPFSGQMFGLEYSLMAFFYGLLLLTVLVDSRFEAAFSNATLRYLGTIAYGLYLLHPTVLYLVRTLAGQEPASHSGWGTVATSLCALILSMGVAAISWKYLEKPLVRRGHRHEYRFPESKVQPDKTVREGVRPELTPVS